MTCLECGEWTNLPEYVGERFAGEVVCSHCGRYNVVFVRVGEIRRQYLVMRTPWYCPSMSIVHQKRLLELGII